MTERSFARLSWLRVGLLSCCLAAGTLAVASCTPEAAAPPGPTATGAASAEPQGAVAPGGSVQAREHARAARIHMLTVRDQFTACERRIERGPGRVPTMAIVGASYTAGVGPSRAALSWADDLARKLRWDAVIYGVPGAGYTRAGADGVGPMTRMLRDEALPGLSPSLVLVQAGYDDGKVLPGVEWQQVLRTVELIRAEAPHARIGLVTVFTSPGPVPARFFSTDATIVAAARAADPNAIIMDPLTGRWSYQHADDGLHPTAAGDAWIAQKVADILGANGVHADPRAAAAPVVCDGGVPVGPQHSHARA